MSLDWAEVDEQILAGIQAYREELQQVRRPDSLPEAIPVEAMEIRPRRANRDERRKQLRHIRREALLISHRQHVLRVLGAVAHAFGITVDQLKSKDMHRMYLVPRHIAYLLLSEMGISSPRLGAFFEVDHTTVLNGIKMTRKKMKSNPGMEFVVQGLRAKLLAGEK